MKVIMFNDVEKIRSLTQEEFNSLMKNNHNMMNCIAYEKGNGSEWLPILTFFIEKQDVITCEKCKSIAKEVDKHTSKNTYILEIQIASKNPNPYGEDAQEYDWFVKARYNVEINKLIIYKAKSYHETPIYENNNGVICRDEVALADCGCNIVDRN